MSVRSTSALSRQLWMAQMTLEWPQKRTTSPQSHETGENESGQGSKKNGLYIDGFFRSYHAGRRRHISKARRQAIIEQYGGLCAYCGYEADTVDHIIPFAYGGSDDDENLVASCAICNCIASDKIFDTFDAKREHIRRRYGPFIENRLKRIRAKLSICADCKAIYAPRVGGSSAVLCGPCYRLDDKKFK